MKTNLSFDAELIAQALKVSGDRNKNVGALRESIARRWAEENREGIAAFNKGIEDRGVWSEGMRNW